MILRPPAHARDGRRRGVILIVVLAILTLFAIMGLTFAIYSSAEATSSRIWKEAGLRNNERNLLRDTAEMAWFLALGQTIYGVPENDQGFVPSALWGHDLARNMYGWNPAGLNDKPYVGTGRLREPLGAPFPTDTEFLVNHTYHQADNFIRYPGRIGTHQPVGGVLFPANRDTTNPLTGDLHVSYTFPDHNNMYLAQVDPVTGQVNVPSFHRDWVAAPGTPPGTVLSTTTAAVWTSPEGKYRMMRPRPAEHPLFPFPADPTGDVKNLDFAPGGNDSIWIDIGAPVMTAPDGVTKFKALIAPLLLDMDGRINVNTAGNLLLARNTATSLHASNQGWGPWEVNPARVLDFAPPPLPTQPPSPPLEWRNLFVGDAAQNLLGRYGQTRTPQGPGGIQGGTLLRRYFPMDYNAITEDAANIEYTANNGSPAGINPYILTPQWKFPGEAATANTPAVPLFQAFPLFSNWGYNNAQPPPPPPPPTPGLTRETHYPNANTRNHPDQFNFFQPAPGNKAFGVNDLVAILRRANVGGDQVASDLMRLLPNNLDGPTNIARRHRVTTHSFDVDRPGSPPYVFTPSGYTYTVPAGQTFGRPAGPAAGLGFPNPVLATRTTTPAGSEFSPVNWASDLSLLSYPPTATPALYSLGAFRAGTRVNLARKLTQYPNPALATWQFDLTNAAQAAQLAQANADRQNMAWEIYTTLWQLAGAEPWQNLVTLARTDARLRPHRWLAQLAANIVDYIDYDDYMTAFQWLPAAPNLAPEYVFGTEMPRLVINEYYAQWDNNMLANNQETSTDYRVNVWAELHNPFPAESSPNDPAGGRAILQRAQGGEAIYRMLLTRGPNVQVRAPENVVGAADAGMGQVGGTLIDWGTTREVRPGQGLYDDGTATNNGFYVAGSNTSYAGAMTAADPFGTTMTPTLASDQMTYTLPLADDPTIAPGMGGTDYRPALLLQRLANPYLPFQDNVANPLYNPYVTVDYVEQMRVNDYRLYNETGTDLMPAGRYTAAVWRSGFGKDQPYAAWLNPADTSTNPTQNWRKQNPTLVNPQPETNRHTFFRHNAIEPTPLQAGQPDPAAVGQTIRPFEVLVHPDRQPPSVADLLHLSGYRPHELTQQFVTYTSAMTPVRQPYSHGAPWADPTVRVARLLEYLTVGSRAAGVATGGRVPGKVNINTIWDAANAGAIFNALADAQGANRFSPAEVNAVWATIVASRGATPGPNARPFWGLGTGHATVADALSQTPRGVTSTTLRPSTTRPEQLLLEPAVAAANPLPPTLMRAELLSKIMGQLTTRSNVFGMWATIGFFRVVDDQQKPVRLGAEMRWPNGGQVRFRTFALIDRTQLQAWPTFDANDLPMVRYGGPAIQFTATPPSTTVPTAVVAPVTLIDAQNQPITPVPGLINPNTNYVWRPQAGAVLTFDPDSPFEETVVLRPNAAGNGLEATFTKPHTSGCLVISRANPGPWVSYDPTKDLGVILHQEIFD